MTVGRARSASRFTVAPCREAGLPTEAMVAQRLRSQRIAIERMTLVLGAGILRLRDEICVRALAVTTAARSM
jgi:hypothetical protein